MTAPDPLRHPRSLASDTSRLVELFGTDDLLPLWIAEPYVPLAGPIRAAIERRAGSGWYGYETRPDSLESAFWEWMAGRHGWNGDGLTTIVSPSVGTSIGVLINELTDEGDGVVIQPPVFTDFKPLIASSGRTVVRNPLVLSDEGYQMDLDGLAELASQPTVRLMILCNPHNPSGDCGRGTSSDQSLASAPKTMLRSSPTRSTPTSPFPQTPSCRSPRRKKVSK